MDSYSRRCRLEESIIIKGFQKFRFEFKLKLKARLTVVEYAQNDCTAGIC